SRRRHTRCYRDWSSDVCSSDLPERRFGVELCNGYGLSEGGTVVTMAPPLGDKRWPSIGLPNGDRQVRIVDEYGRELPAGAVGERSAERRGGEGAGAGGPAEAAR